MRQTFIFVVFSNTEKKLMQQNTFFSVSNFKIQVVYSIKSNFLPFSATAMQLFLPFSATTMKILLPFSANGNKTTSLPMPAIETAKEKFLAVAGNGKPGAKNLLPFSATARR